MDSEKYSVADSVLGTKEFWDSRYELEIKNFKEYGDEGEIWFGKNAEDRMLLYIDKLKLSKDIYFIDIGTGNDYSPFSIELSKKLSNNDDNECSKIVYEVDNVLSDSHSTDLINKFNIILDKGTWDAISLFGDREERLNSYKKSIDTFFVNDTSQIQLFIIVSCNFTKEELIELFESDNLKFETDLPPSKTFSFGGRVGQTFTGAVFKREKK